MKAKTRTELISAAALKFGGDAPIARRYFIAGAEWADKNPVAVVPAAPDNSEELAAALAEVASLKAQLEELSATKEQLAADYEELSAAKEQLAADYEELAAEKARLESAKKAPAKRGRKKVAEDVPSDAPAESPASNLTESSE